jgi:hypothetical protein
VTNRSRCKKHGHPIEECEECQKAEEAKKEHALVLVPIGGGSFLIHGVGYGVEGDLDAGLGRDEAGPTGLAPEEPGFWVWEGTPFWTDGRTSEGVDEGAEPIYEKHGAWRRPTPHELTLICAGDLKGLWGPSKWPPPPMTEDEKASKLFGG